MRIHYLALHEPSGYAVAAQRCMRALRGAGAELRWIPFVPGPAWGLGYEPASADEVDDPSLHDLLAGPERCDVVVAHLVPEYWPLVRARYPGVPLVGHTVWETDRLPAHWPPLLDVADLIVVPTEWNRELLERSGLRPPVRVAPHVAAAPASVSSEVWNDLPEASFVAYGIAPWTARKALAETVRAYQSAFAGRDDTVLVLKTSERDFADGRSGSPGPVAPGTSAWTLAGLLAGIERPAPVRLVTAVLDDRDIDALHTRGDCYLSLARSEGWGIPAFDAAAAGKPVVITGYGGHCEFLNDSSAFLVDYDLVAVDDPAGGGSYTPDQRWARPSIEHAAALLRAVAADPAEASARGQRARSRVLTEFAAPVVAAAFLAALGELR